MKTALQLFLQVFKVNSLEIVGIALAAGRSIFIRAKFLRGLDGSTNPKSNGDG